MPRILQFKTKDKQGKLRDSGYMEIKNQTGSNAELYLYGDIISHSMSENYKNYYPDDKCPQDIKDFLDEIGDVGSLDIHINSGGGSVFGGIAIYNLLKNHKAYKTVYVDAIAASIASVIACVGDKIVMPKNATFMIHKPMNGYFFSWMNADELRKDAETLDSCQKAIVNTYMGKVKDGITRETIEELVNNETWMVGDEVAQYFDFEISESVEAAACGSEYFSKYENAPEAYKEKPGDNGVSAGIDVEVLAGMVAEKFRNDAEAELEIRKNKLLEDLDLI